MFLSQLILNPRSRGVQRDLEDPYRMHKTLSRAFTAGCTDEDGKKALNEARALFRVDDDKGRLHVIVQSKTAPDWSVLAFSDYVWEAPRVRPFDLSNDVICVGRRFSFRLLANPTKRDNQSARRVGLYREWERLAWLHRKALAGGFQLEEQTIQVRQPNARGVENDSFQWVEMCLPAVGVTDLNDGKRFPLLMAPPKSSVSPDAGSVAMETKLSGKAQFSAARFEGVLQITDAQAFRAALENGIGSAKGFGFGLLSLARA